MNKKTLRPMPARCIVETLEARTLLSAGAVSPSVGTHDGAHATFVLQPHAATSGTKTTLKVAPHSAKLGQNVKLSATVKANVRGTALAGVVEFLDNGTPIRGPGGALTVPLTSGRASYALGTGNLALFAGKHSLTAEFIGNDTTLNSTSRAVGVNITVPRVAKAANGLETATVKRGTGKTGVAAGQTVHVLYTGFLNATGTIFDYASANHGPNSTPDLQFVVEATPQEQVIPGFDQGVLGMKVGETRVIAFPSALGYGARGAGSSIPPNADLVFLVTLLSIS